MHDDLDLNLEPSEPSVPDVDQGGVSLPKGEVDHEGAMAKADLYKLANYSLKLFKKIQDGDQLEGWVQAKITKAADYIASVYHYLEYEMEFSEYGKKLDNSDVLSESQKEVLKNKLMEAKAKIKELKVKQAEKQFGLEEGILSGGEESCPHCNGTGTVVKPAREVPEAVKEKVRKYNRQAKAFHAASKRIDANKNGIPDDEEFNEASADEPAAPDADAIAKKKAREAAARRREEKAEADKDDLSKDYSPKSEKTSSSRKVSGKAYGGEKQKDAEVDEAQGGIYGKGVYEGKKAKKDYDGDGKIESEKDEVWGSRLKAAKKAGKMEEAAKPDFLDMDKDGDKKEPMKKAIKDKAKKVKESEEKRAPAKKTTRTVDLPSGKKGTITKVQGWQSQKAEKAAEKEKGLDESNDPYDDYRKRKMSDRLARGVSPDEATKFDRTTTTKKGTFSKKADRYDPETGKLVKQNVGRTKQDLGRYGYTQGVAEAHGHRSSHYDHTDQERREQDTMDWNKRDFKRREMEYELRHEDDKPAKKVKENAPLTPQQAAELAKSSDPNAYNKLKGIPTPKKTTPVVSPDEGPTKASKPAVVKESAELERMKEFLTRLNG